MKKPRTAILMVTIIKENKGGNSPLHFTGLIGGKRVYLLVDSGTLDFFAPSNVV